MDKLAKYGGKAIINTYLSYGRQTIDEDDINSALKVLKSDYYNN